MDIAAAQLEMRTRFVGGFHGQLTSGLLWLVSASVATWSGPRAANSLRRRGMQVAFVLPVSMPLLRAHYLPFVFLYGMRMFAVLAAILAWGGMPIAVCASRSFSLGAWFTGATLLLFAGVGVPQIRAMAKSG